MQNRNLEALYEVQDGGKEDEMSVPTPSNERAPLAITDQVRTCESFDGAQVWSNELGGRGRLT